MILLDINVLSEPLKPRPDATAVTWLDAQETSTLYLPSVVLAELLLGAALLPPGRRRGMLEESLRRVVRDYIGERVLVFDRATAEQYAAAVSAARTRGLAIGVADAQIAAIALTHGYIVATRDVRPFIAAGAEVINPWGEPG